MVPNAQTATLERPPSYGHEIVEYASLFRAFFNLKENPFTNTPDPDFFFMSSQHREALVNLLFGVEQSKGFMVVTGEIGAGKTTLCRQFLREVSKQVKTAVILNPNLSRTHLLASIINDLGLKDTVRSRRDQFEILNRFLLELAEQNGKACLVIDEAQCLNPLVLEEIRLLSNLETSKQKLLQIILVGQPELQKLLKRHSLLQLRQRIGIVCHLQGMACDETGAYIRHRLVHGSEGTPQAVFEDTVIEKIHEISRGIPRLINLLCDRALIAAFARQTHRIAWDEIAAGIEELSFIYT